LPVTAAPLRGCSMICGEDIVVTFEKVPTV
jgi:hypothetical protein